MSRRREKGALALALLLAVFCILLAFPFGKRVHTDCYEEQLSARVHMEKCMAAIRDYRQARGIEMSPEDIRQTGLIGPDFGDVTTSIGHLEAKRTAADPDMAALVVRMFHEAGLKAGDRVGAGFSGSFPGMNLAVLSACEAMDIELTLISSVGSSNFGANDPRLTFPEIIHMLYLDGLISTDSVLVTPGGDHDVGLGVLDEPLFATLVERVESLGLPVMVERDYQKNLAARRDIYTQADIQCFVAVGGNVTSTGRNDSALTLGQGLIRSAAVPRNLTENSGMVEWYVAQGMTVINLLNIRELVTDYGMPFDPQVQAAPGESPAYYTVYYPRVPLLFGFAAVWCVLYLIHREKQKKRRLFWAKLTRTMQLEKDRRERR